MSLVSIIAALRVAPGGEVGPLRRSAFGGDDGAHTWQSIPDLADLGDELGADEQHRRLAVLDDEGDLGSREPPVHRCHHHAGLHRSHQQLEIDVAVLAEIGDAIALLDVHRYEPVGDLVGLDVEFDRTGDAPLELIGDGVAAALRALAYHVGEIRQWLCGGHVSPVAFCSLCRGVWRHPRAKTIWEGDDSCFNIVVLAFARTTMERLSPSRSAILLVLRSDVVW